MRDDELRDFLQNAERGLSRRAIDPGELAGRVRTAERASLRRHRTMAASGVVVAALAAVAWWASPSTENVAVPIRPQPQVAMTSPDLVTSEEIERLEAEAETHLRKARALMIARRGPSPLDDDPVADLREDLDVVAYGIIQRADELRATRMQEAEAIELYRNVVRRFPKTYSAQVAQQRLQAIEADLQETTS